MRRITARLVTLSLMAAISGLTASTATAHAAAPAATCDGKAATIVGTDGPDHLTGTPGSDVIAGLGGDDVIKGLGGNDVLCGDDDADTLDGGAGDDFLSGGHDRTVDTCDDGCFVLYGDRLDGGLGNDVLDPGFTDPVGGHRTGFGDALVFRGSARGVTLDRPARTVRGQGDDRIVDPHPASRLEFYGGTGDDHLIGGPGPEYFAPGPGDDVVEAGNGRDDVTDDGAVSRDVISGGGGADVLRTATGRDRVSGGPGDDQLDAAHHDGGKPYRLYGDAGNDSLILANVPDGLVVDAGAGADTVTWVPKGARRLDLDLAKGTVSQGSHRGRTRNVHVWDVAGDGSLTVTGSRGHDDIGADVPEVVAELRGGNDLLRPLREVVDGPMRVRASMGAGRDRVKSFALGPMRLSLGSGADLVEAHEGYPYAARIIRGGPGVDTVRLNQNFGYTCSSIEHGTCDSTQPVIRCAGKVATIVGTGAADTITGTDGPDVIAALGGRDRIHAGGGDDTICTGPGHRDLAHGDAGNDHVYGSQQADNPLLDGGAGKDVLVPDAASRPDLVGGSGDDVIRGPGTVSFAAAPGPVTVDLAAGTAVGDGSDTLTGSLSVVGSAFGDHINGTAGADYVASGPGDDTVTVGGGNDTVDAGTGNDVVDLGGGRDQVEEQTGDTGDDTYAAGPGNDDVTVNSGTDTVDGGAGVDNVTVDPFPRTSRGPVSVSNADTVTIHEIVAGDQVHDVGLADIRLRATTEPVTLDLPTGTLTQGPTTLTSSGVSSWDLASFSASLTRVSGTDGVDHVFLGGDGASYAVDLGGGNDVLGLNDAHGTVQLGDGDDVLNGHTVSDSTLDGGPGNDAVSIDTSSGNTCQNFETGSCG